MLKRRVTPTLTELLSHYPAVALLGPRQCGKTTLAQSLSGHYFDMEQSSDRVSLDIQWDKLMEKNELVILDEAQTWPELFPRLRGAIDKRRKQSGRFLLLGSIAPSLMRQVSESLAGRLALCELTPLLLSEISSGQADDLWLMGGYPDGGIIKHQQFKQWQLDYLTLLAQRDLPAWGLPSKPQMTQRFFAMLAALHGGIWNASGVGKSLGVSYHTVNTYLDYLEQAYLTRRLPAYAGNAKKRLVKSPKVYWRDSGLLHSLMGVNNFDQLLSQPWVGHSWEGWVIEQILGCLSSQGQTVTPSFLRTQQGNEADLVLEYAKQRWVIEIKLTSHPDTTDLASLRAAGAVIQANRLVLISRTKKSVTGSGIISTNLQTFLQRFLS